MIIIHILKFLYHSTHFQFSPFSESWVWRKTSKLWHNPDYIRVVFFWHIKAVKLKKQGDLLIISMRSCDWHFKECTIFGSIIDRNVLNVTYVPYFFSTIYKWRNKQGCIFKCKSLIHIFATSRQSYWVLSFRRAILQWRGK